ARTRDMQHQRLTLQSDTLTTRPRRPVWVYQLIQQMPTTGTTGLWVYQLIQQMPTTGTTGLWVYQSHPANACNGRNNLASRHVSSSDKYQPLECRGCRYLISVTRLIAYS
ncbi:hypothetical protein EQH57_0400, partial [Dictyocoela roeselum]